MSSATFLFRETCSSMFTKSRMSDKWVCNVVPETSLTIHGMQREAREKALYLEAFLILVALRRSSVHHVS